MSWTGQTEAELTRLVGAGLTSNQVQSRMPQFSRSAIVAKASRLELKWATQAVGGRACHDMPPQKRAQIVALLRTGRRPSGVAKTCSVLPRRVTEIMAEEGIPWPDKPAQRGRLIRLQAKKRPAMVIADMRQFDLSAFSTRPPIPNTPDRPTRTCQYIVTDERPWLFCPEKAVIGAWCAGHFRRCCGTKMAEAAD